MRLRAGRRQVRDDGGGSADPLRDERERVERRRDRHLAAGRLGRRCACGRDAGQEDEGGDELGHGRDRSVR